jgi:protein-S-isoprenylcysteine O-methyltransferase Ste14
LARPFFVGTTLSSSAYLYLLPGDLIAIVFASIEAVRHMRNDSSFSWRGSVVTVMTLWGTAEALYLAWKVPSTAWGFYCMLLAATLLISTEIAGRKIPIIWGPFRFGKCERQSQAQLIRSVAAQIAVMWGIFLVIVPITLSRVESIFGWTVGKFEFHGRVWLGILLALGFGACGIASARVMIVEGGGTPLPISGTCKLVVAGPYAYCRNPMALSGILQGVSVGIALGSGLVIVYSVCGAILWDFCVRTLEENYLLAEFGHEYAAYRDSVRCWRVRLKRYRVTVAAGDHDAV